MPSTLLRSHSAWLASAIIVAGLVAAGPVAQTDGYHGFADARALGALPHAADVLSNLGFLFAGMYGFLLPGRRDPAYATLCAALVATAFGSSWYHLAPDDARLVWDRLPIALACAAVLARVLNAGLLALAAAAVASVFWWVWSGDLRPYLLLQILPLVAAPSLQWQRRAPARERLLFGYAVGLYVLAKLCEVGDHALFGWMQVLSGHTLKHLLATGAALCLLRAWGLNRAAAPAACRNCARPEGQ